MVKFSKYIGPKMNIFEKLIPITRVKIPEFDPVTGESFQISQFPLELSYGPSIHKIQVI